MPDQARFTIKVDWDEGADKAECTLSCRPVTIPRDMLSLATAFLMAYAASRDPDGYEAGLDDLREMAMKARFSKGKK